ncbi:unnamed protein product [Schistosoma curassoni]|uniref:Uncharacterized protein n=1 Tax=Schistosoma curassoni TaxID=6186 RepID=A0A183L715_9TREM|nr:unnamed protein product [Schistosoma curassoni]
MFAPYIFCWTSYHKYVFTSKSKQSIFQYTFTFKFSISSNTGFELKSFTECTTAFRFNYPINRFIQFRF